VCATSKDRYWDENPARQYLALRKMPNEGSRVGSPDDHYRYIEHLQGQNLAPDWEILYDAARFKTWVANNGARLQKLASHPWELHSASIVRRLEEDVMQFQPATRFELPTTKLNLPANLR
jgi:hypothetical protein